MAFSPLIRLQVSKDLRFVGALGHSSPLNVSKFVFFVFYIIFIFYFSHSSSSSLTSTAGARFKTLITGGGDGSSATNVINRDGSKCVYWKCGHLDSTCTMCYVLELEFNYATGGTSGGSKGCVKKGGEGVFERIDLLLLMLV
jgi:hypothetical protein